MSAFFLAEEESVTFPTSDCINLTRSVEETAPFSSISPATVTLPELLLVTVVTLGVVLSSFFIVIPFCISLSNRLFFSKYTPFLKQTAVKAVCQLIIKV